MMAETNDENNAKQEFKSDHDDEKVFYPSIYRLIAWYK